MKYLLIVVAFYSLHSSVKSQQRYDALAKQIVAIEKKYSRLLPVGLSISEGKAILGNPDAVQAGFPDTQESIVDAIPEFHGQLNYTAFVYMPGSPLRDSRKVKQGGEILGGGATVDGFTVDKNLWDKYRTSDSIFFRPTKSYAFKIKYPSGSRAELKTDNDYSRTFNTGDSVIPYQANMWRLRKFKANDVRSNFMGFYEGMLDSIVLQEIVDPTASEPDRVAKSKKACAIEEIPIEKIPVKTVTQTLILKPLLFVLFDRGTQVVADRKVLFLKSSEEK